MDVHPPKNGMYRYWSIAIYQSYMNHIHIHISIYLYIMMTIYPQLGVALNKKTSPHRRAKHLTISVAVRLIDHLLELLCRPVISWQVFAEFHHIYIYTYICVYVYIYMYNCVYVCNIYIVSIILHIDSHRDSHRDSQMLCIINFTRYIVQNPQKWWILVDFVDKHGGLSLFYTV